MKVISDEELKPLVPFIEQMETDGEDTYVTLVFPSKAFSTFKFFQYFQQPFTFTFDASMANKKITTKFLDNKLGTRLLLLWIESKKTQLPLLSAFVNKLFPQKENQLLHVEQKTLPYFEGDEVNLCIECNENQITHIPQDLCDSCWEKYLNK